MNGLRVATVVVGAQRDGGFNQAALDGLVAAERLPGIVLEGVLGAAFDPAPMTAALDAAAARVGAGGLVLFIGGQGDRVTPEAASRWPDRRFSVVQGSVTGPNLSSVHVRQEDSAFLAGVLAAGLTQSGTVGHLSGHRVAPGLRGRAAFAAGVRHADPAVTLLTAFCGTQDDRALAGRWASGQLAAGADILFTMLNGAREGATAACRAAGAMQIGNARDWVAVDPAVFVASALARIDLAVVRAVEDALSGKPMDAEVSLGLRDAGDGPAPVALVVRPDVTAAARVRVAEAEAALRSGELTPPPAYDGAEFALDGALR